MQIQAYVFRVTDDKQKLTSVAVYDTMRSQFRGRQLDYTLEWTKPYRDFENGADQLAQDHCHLHAILDADCE